jgi:cob(I)alamin adenosyltransferase
MKIYTKTGDLGMTSLFGGTRVPKHHIRIETYGTLDELNSYIGLLKDQGIKTEYLKTLEEVQDRLFTIGAFMATPPEKEVKKNGEMRLSIGEILPQDIELLEKAIDEMDNSLPPMTHFILPGGHQTVSFCHVARCVCRRAERLSVQLNEYETLNPMFISYLNRLSDYLFVLARKLSNDLGIEDIKWIPRN